jgi:hypothetical protein
MIKELLKDPVDSDREKPEMVERTPNIGPLTKLLAEAGGDLRLVSAERALEALTRIEEEPGLWGLIRYLAHHPSAHLRSKIALLVGRANPDVERVRSLMATSDGRLRANAVESLWGSSDPAVLELFRSAANDPYSRVAVNALVGLSRAGDMAAHERLARWASFEDSPRRAGALWALAELRKHPWAPRRGKAKGDGTWPEAPPTAGRFTAQGAHAEQLRNAGTALLQSALSVLEEMCFITAACTPAALMPSNSLTVQVEFRGYWKGRCLMQISEGCGRILAANFAGTLDPLAVDMQTVTELLCEFVNILCGGTIARLDCPGITVLAPPHLLWEWPPSPAEAPEVERWLDTGRDAIRLGFHALAE